MRKGQSVPVSADSAQVVIVVVDCKNGFRCSFLQLHGILGVAAVVVVVVVIVAIVVIVVFGDVVL